MKYYQNGQMLNATESTNIFLKNSFELLADKLIKYEIN